MLGFACVLKVNIPGHWSDGSSSGCDSSKKLKYILKYFLTQVHIHMYIIIHSYMSMNTNIRTIILVLVLVVSASGSG